MGHETGSDRMMEEGCCRACGGGGWGGGAVTGPLGVRE